ncbi:beta-glucosidase [Monoraphidium neglectum]|uniref:Beta-glucosidase n=1 Tax=Monoraphidium neglectum TaxID=145388 RepID=A0A0D2MNY3_9CHLO|nr:beta-glucosidase [Monoraphidium neglectum]KIZ04410.1 beta-glucosidase [Monoraphidium neglectum]|eukprot:XP_013903429.1 beta-glucosidase [Monoraphidium neglectum]
MRGSMMAKLAFLGLLLLCAAAVEAREPKSKNPPIKNLPAAPKACTKELRKKIVWGGATSAYQIEGAWNEDGKGPSIWDTFSQKGGETVDNANGNVANDFYHRWQGDVAMMKKLGVKTYRMSIAWTRIVPTGAAGSPINAKGVEFYRTLITELLKNGIVPAITMFHWDLPQGLQDTIKGFHAEGTAFQDAFVYYADTLFRELGPLVKLWMTFNEPMSICDLGYGQGVFAPGIKGGAAGQYKCGHNLLLAHAKTVKLYREKYMGAQDGKISMALDGKYGYPLTDSAADKQAAQYWMEFQYGWMADPVYFGDYPTSMHKFMGDKLPKFTPEESVLLKGSQDYFACNFYNGYFIKAPADPNSEFPYEVTMKNEKGQWVGEPSASSWLFRTPDGLRKTLVWLDSRYSVDGRKVEFTISENGVSGPGEASLRPPAVLQDNYRLRYYSTYLDNLCLAITEDNIKFSTYWAWSLWDNFEWRQAYTERFGMIYVDLKNGLERVPKASAYWMSKYFWSESALFESSYYKGLYKNRHASKERKARKSSKA